MEPDWVKLCGQFGELSICHGVNQLTSIVGKTVPDREILIVELQAVTAVRSRDFADRFAVMVGQRVIAHAVSWS